MSDENLGDVLNNSMLSYMKDSAIKHLVSRQHLRLGQIVELCNHPEQGKAVGSITLAELVEAAVADVADSAPDVEEEAVSPKKAKTSSKKKVAKKKVKKTSSKKTAKKAEKKTAAKKTSSKKGAAKDKKPKADKGKPKPRLDYDRGMKEVLAALKAAGGPCGRKTLENATGYSAVQIRTFAKKLEDRGKISISGSGRNTQYERT